MAIKKKGLEKEELEARRRGRERIQQSRRRSTRSELRQQQRSLRDEDGCDSETASTTLGGHVIQESFLTPMLLEK